MKEVRYALVTLTKECNMHINYRRGETRQFVSLREGLLNRRRKYFFPSSYFYNKIHRSKVKYKMKIAQLNDDWDNYASPLLDESVNPWDWD